MRVTTCLHGNEEKNEADNGEESSDEVNFSDDLLGTFAMSTSLRSWEIEDGNSNEGDAVPNHADPNRPAPRVIRA